MVPGYNTDFKYRGETYHVQTEDNGVGNPVVVTLLYHKGAILASRRTPYRDLLGKPGFEQALAGLMKSQHKDLMRALLAGTYDKNGAAPATKPVADPLLPEQAPGESRQAVPAASEALRKPLAPRTTALSLDEAIRHYLEAFAAAVTTH
jgi:hypothetical protein